jgi:hypothetical protein
MRFLNINLHFYPRSYGGATIVAERLAHGLIELGHEVINVALGRQQANGQDFETLDTPFGTVLFLNGIEVSPRTRFHNPPASSLIRDICDLVQPDRVVLHAAQHLGIAELVGDRALLARTTIVAHDCFWVCIEGHRMLPSGRPCARLPSSDACHDCSYYPGLSSSLYAMLADCLEQCEQLVFPSTFIADEYAANGSPPGKGRVIGNPDLAENLFGGAERTAADAVRVGYFGGPGSAKGWDIVRAQIGRLHDVDDRPLHYALFDAGTALGAPWYRGVKLPDHADIRPSFHWSRAWTVLSQIDVALVPSRVRESFGLAAREILSTGGSAVIFPSGALAELESYDGVHVADEGSIDDALRAAVATKAQGNNPYKARSSVEYAGALAALS